MVTGDRDINMDQGNYNERVERNVIHAQQVNVIENNYVPEKPDITGEKSSIGKRLVFAIAGSIDEVDQSKLKVIAALLQDISGDTSIKIIDAEEGSIKLILDGSPEGLKRLKELFESGELTEIDGVPVEYVHFLDTEIANNDANIEAERKSRLVKEIRTKYIPHRNLRGANLRGADLSSANLINADLRSAHLSSAHLSFANLSSANLILANLNNAYLIRAYLIGANLSNADLSDAELSSADLSNADLSDADLSNAKLKNTKINEKTKLDDKWLKVWEIVNRGGQDQDLSNIDLSSCYLRNADLSGARLVKTNLNSSQLNNANLSGANLIGANLNNAQLLKANLTDADLSGAHVENTRFGYNAGISGALKRDLIARGAIFEDSPGDRAEVLTPVS